MDDLQRYIEGEYQEDISEIDELLSLISQILPTFSTLFVGETGRWPYEVVAEQEDWTSGTKGTYSYSTNAMIAHMAGVTLWGGNESVLVPAIRSDDRLKFDVNHPTFNEARKEHLQKSFRRACEALAETLKTPPDIATHRLSKDKLHEDFKNRTDRLVTLSGTYGCNDPFTLTWVAETLAMAKNHLEMDCSAALERVQEAASETARAAYEKPNISPLRLQAPEVEGYAHAFPLLRCVQLAHMLTSPLDASSTALLTKLQNIVFQQISFSSIRGSEFDAAELVFALEGTLRLQPEFDRSVIDRAFRAIERKQRSVPNWRPLRPYIATPQGFVLLPISVEIANFLLRICDLLDRDSTTERFFSRYLGVFRKYSRWLCSRSTKGRASIPDGTGTRDAEFLGWHSEHILKPGSIHLWMTSQVILFLMHYASMLRAHVAFRSLRAGRFAVTWRLRTRDEQSRRVAKEKAVDKLINDLEPLTDESLDNSSYKVSRRIQDYYISPRNEKSGLEKHYSMLLYGPPGTGKTTFAEELARGSWVTT